MAEREPRHPFLDELTAAPEIEEFYLDHFYRRLFYAGRLPVRTKELVRLKLSNLHACAS